jgi:hypothetical protein
VLLAQDEPEAPGEQELLAVLLVGGAPVGLGGQEPRAVLPEEPLAVAELQDVVLLVEPAGFPGLGWPVLAGFPQPEDERREGVPLVLYTAWRWGETLPVQPGVRQT